MKNKNFNPYRVGITREERQKFYLHEYSQKQLREDLNIILSQTRGSAGVVVLAMGALSSLCLAILKKK